MGNSYFFIIERKMYGQICHPQLPHQIFQIHQIHQNQNNHQIQIQGKVQKKIPQKN